MQNKKIILKNFFSLSGGELLSKAIAFVTTVYLARVILPEGFGVLGYAMAFVSYFLLFIDFGFDIISVKKIANDNSLISKFVNGVVSFRLVLALAVFMILATVVYFLNETAQVKAALLLAGMNLFAQAITTEFVFQATEKIKYLAIKVVLKNILILVGVFAFVKDVSDVLLVLAFSFAANLAMNLWLYSRYVKLFDKFKWTIDKAFLRKMISESFPLIISSFMISIYYNLDMVMLGNIKTPAEVGVYNAAYKIFLIGLIPLGAIVKIFLPSLSKIDDKKELKNTLKNYGAFMFASGAAISLFIFLAADKTVAVVYGDKYLDAGFPLMILALNILVISVNVFFGNPLTVWGKQKAYSIAITLGAVANVILNLVFIPKYSFNGAALATLLSEAVVFVGVFYLFNKNFKEIFQKIPDI